MADFNKLKSDNMRNDDHVIHEQTNPSFHDTPEDSKNYKSLQNKSSVPTKKSLFTLKPSLLTQKAEQIRTDKAAVSNSINNTSTNKFLVLGENTKDLSNTQNSDQTFEKTKSNDSSGFIFGENIFSRVMKPDLSKSSEESSKEFKDLVCDNSSVVTAIETDNDALRKSAKELSQKQITQQYEEAEVITGEEEETNVLKALCKLFIFNSEKNEWVEKGFCNIHLNDMIEDKLNLQIKSRLVVRSKGGLKVLVNTSIWSEMGLARASSKAVRITAQSDEGIKSFLFTMQNATDADSVYHALLTRKMRLAKENRMKQLTNVSSDRKRELPDSDDSEDAFINTKVRVIEHPYEDESEGQSSDQ